MSVFIIPESNPLRFVRKDAQANTTYKTFDNMSAELQKFGRETIHPYFRKVSIGDTLLVQFTTDYTTILIELYDNDNVLQDTLSLITAYTFQDSSGIKIYDCFINTSLLGGYYYVKISASGAGRPDLIFDSDVFNVDDYSYLPYFQYSKKERSGCYFGLGEFFNFRLECSFDADFEHNDEQYEGYNGINELLKSDVRRIYKIASDDVDMYTAQLVNIALSHTEVYFNGIRISKKGKIKIEPTKSTNLYSIEADVQDSIFGDYTTLVDQGGAPEGTSELKYSDESGDYLIWSDDITDTLKYT